MDSRALLTLATSAKNEYVNVEAANEDLKQILDSQKVLINDYAESMPDIDLTEKHEAELDEELTRIDEQLAQSQLILLELLQSKPQATDSEKCNATLKAILTTFQHRVSELTKEAVGAGQASVTVFQIIDLEEEISKLIDSLISKDMYPEEEKDKNAREQKTKTHNTKLAQYLQFLRQIIAQANAQRNQQPAGEGQ